MLVLVHCITKVIIIIIIMIRHPVPVQPNHYYKIAICTKVNVKSIQCSSFNHLKLIPSLTDQVKVIGQGTTIEGELKLR